MAKKSKLAVVSALVAAFTTLAAAVVFFSIPSVPEMFRMNKQLQEEGYYMAEFEFKMVGLTYWLDRGRYWTAFTKMRELNDKLKTRKGLVKLPKFRDKNEETEFYLNLQNPRTGAFMDDSYPLCTFTGPTGNVLNLLDELARETGRPVKLKHPLKYLDGINTPEKLKAYLDDAATVGWIGLKFPQTSFHFTRCLLSMFHEDSVVEKYGLYDVSPEWKRALLEWFFLNQDPATGVWGPKGKDGRLAKKDTQNTSSILKAFVDEEGRDLHRDFPLRYRNELARTILEEVDPVPKDDALHEWHEWNLKTAKSLRTLVRYLWSGLSEDTKAKAKELNERFVGVKFEKFYVEKDGAFSYYPGSDRATLDGTSGMIGMIKDLGCFSPERLLRLWGPPEKYCVDLGGFMVPEITEADFREKTGRQGANSFRVYAMEPRAGAYSENVLGVFYPCPVKTAVPDVMELVPRMQAWIRTTDQSMGNWTSREDLARNLVEMKATSVPVWKDGFPGKELGEALKQYGGLTVFGFDVLQAPKFRIAYSLRR